VVIAGGGVAALETALALADLASDRTEVIVIIVGEQHRGRAARQRERRDDQLRLCRGSQLPRSGDQSWRTPPGGGSGDRIARALRPCRARHSLGEHGFIRVDPHCRVPDVEHIYAAGDATDFPIKQGGIGSQQADVAAQSIAALAGAPGTPERFNPTIHGMLLTNGKPQYLTAHITRGHGFSSEITDMPTSSPPSKIAAKYLAPYLEKRDRESTST
jgi:hypothetical protein